LDITYVVILVVVFVAIGTIAGKKKKRNFKYKPDEEWPFHQKNLLSEVEKKLFAKLITSLPEYFIFSQVQISQLIDVKKGHNFQQWFNRINRMSADFVVLNQELKTIAVIELDDSTHNRKDRIESDKKKDKALASAGLKTIRWKVGRVPSTESIREQIITPDTSPKINDIKALNPELHS
jgi:very-short-patch-repair endonuclease